MLLFPLAAKALFLSEAIGYTLEPTATYSRSTWGKNKKSYASTPPIRLDGVLFTNLTS
jgi:hypothetical protein